MPLMFVIETPSAEEEELSCFVTVTASPLQGRLFVYICLLNSLPLTTAYFTSVRPKGAHNPYNFSSSATSRQP
jgi:hypothetical protein